MTASCDAALTTPLLFLAKYRSGVEVYEIIRLDFSEVFQMLCLFYQAVCTDLL